MKNKMVKDEDIKVEEFIDLIKPCFTLENYSDDQIVGLISSTLINLMLNINFSKEKFEVLIEEIKRQFYEKSKLSIKQIHIKR